LGLIEDWAYHWSRSNEMALGQVSEHPLRAIPQPRLAANV